MSLLCLQLCFLLIRFEWGKSVECFYHLWVFYCVYYSDQVHLVWCLPSIIQQVMLFRYLQFGYLIILVWMKRGIDCWWISFCIFPLFVFTIKVKYFECCGFLQRFAQWCCSCVSNLVLCWLYECKERVDDDKWLLCSPPR